MCLRLLHPANARLDIFVIELGSSRDTNPVQPSNALYPILVTDEGILMDFNPVKPLKALWPMHVTELGMIVFLQPATSVFVDVSIIALQLSHESIFGLLVSTLITSRFMGIIPEALYTFSMVLGSVIDLSSVQYLRASLSMPTTL